MTLLLDWATSGSSANLTASSHTSTVDNASASTLDSASGSGSGFRGDLIPLTWELDIPPCADSLHCESIDPVDAQDGNGSGNGGVLMLDSRRKHWSMFVAGNLISVAVIVSLIAQLKDVCYDENVDGENDDARRSLVEEDPSQNTVSPIDDTILFTLMFGLCAEGGFATALSLYYRSPLGITSVHKIPPEPLTSFLENQIVCLVASLSWSMIYLLGSNANQFLSSKSPCERQGGSGLDNYLAISGSIMGVVGLALLYISLWDAWFCFGLLERCLDGCRSVVQRIISQHILSKGLFLDAFWKVQGLVWAYRTGRFDLGMSIFVGICSVVGVTMTAIGSLAPDMRNVSQGDRNTPTLADDIELAVSTFEDAL